MFVVGVGIGGIVMGVGEVLKVVVLDIKVAVVEFAVFVVLSGKFLLFYYIEGIGVGFVLLIFNCAIIDEVIMVEDREVFDMIEELVSKEFLFVGILFGVNVVGVQWVVKKFLLG